MSKVDYIHLRELCTVNQGLQIPIEQRFLDPGENRFFYITVQFLKDGHLEKFYIENPPKSTICYEDDLIIVRTGSTGQVLTGITGCFHNNFFKVNYNKELLNHKYLYYCLTSKEKQKEMLMRAGITTIPDLNHFMFLDIKIPYQNLPTQQKIAAVLSALDDKIEVNNKINAALEAMAKTLYDYWFVQFEFPITNESHPELVSGSHPVGYKSSGGKMVYNSTLKREIPDGWEVKNIQEIANIVDCLHSKKPDYFYESEKYYLAQLENILDNGQFDNSYKYFVSKSDYEIWTSRIEVQKDDILITNAGRVGANCQLPKNIICGIGRNITAIRPTTISPTYFHLSFNAFDIQKQIKSNTDQGAFFQSLNVKGIKKLYFIIPNKNILQSFENKVIKIREKRDLNLKQNQELAQLRDWLLPMLMNGQVTVE